MICWNKIEDFHIEEPTALSLGKFDGVHRGHEALIEHLLEKKKEGLKAVVFTFDIPPKKLTENNNYRVLSTNKEKQEILKERGIDYLLECPFTKEVMCMEPEAFVAWIVKSLHVKSMVVGSDFRFGHNRKGDHILLEKLSATYGYTLRVVDKIQYEGRDISSTFVREQIIKGNMEKANDLLGYPFFVKSESWKAAWKNARNPDDQYGTCGRKTSSAERCICNCGRDWWKILHRCDKCRMQTDRQSFQ